MSASGNRASLYGLNVIGLKRQGFSEELIDDLKLAYKIIFRSKLILSDAIKKVRGEIVMSKELEYFLNFIEASERGNLQVMETIGLIAGDGQFPILFAEGVKKTALEWLPWD